VIYDLRESFRRLEDWAASGFGIGSPSSQFPSSQRMKGRSARREGFPSEERCVAAWLRFAGAKPLLRIRKEHSVAPLLRCSATDPGKVLRHGSGTRVLGVSRAQRRGDGCQTSADRSAAHTRGHLLARGDPKPANTFSPKAIPTRERLLARGDPNRERLLARGDPNRECPAARRYTQLRRAASSERQESGVRTRCSATGEHA
jgi:hypothetical protein